RTRHRGASFAHPGVPRLRQIQPADGVYVAIPEDSHAERVVPEYVARLTLRHHDDWRRRVVRRWRRGIRARCSGTDRDAGCHTNAGRHSPAIGWENRGALHHDGKPGRPGSGPGTAPSALPYGMWRDAHSAPPPTMT